MSFRDQPFDTGLHLDELDPERPRPLETPWGTMALYLVDGRPHCIQAFCPHMLGPLFEGSVAGGAVTCPWHAWRFDIATGRRLDEPGEDEGESAARPLGRLEVQLGPGGALRLRPFPSARGTGERDPSAPAG